MPSTRRILLAFLLIVLLGACGGASTSLADPPSEDPPSEDPPTDPPPAPPAPPPPGPAECGTVATIEDGRTPTAEIHVATDGDDGTGDGTQAKPYATLARALQVVRPGEAVRIHPGTYAGRLWIENVVGDEASPIWIGGVPGQAKPRVEGGTEGIHLVKVRYVILHDLEVTGATVNGINCDDGGELDDVYACGDLLFRDLHVHDIGEGGNHDGLKLSGLNRYVVKDCLFERVSAGSGIDHVGCHEGVIVGCRFDEMGSNAVQCKGGTRDVLITRCTLDRAGQRGINIGGSTGFDYFRPPLSATEPNAEARDVRVIANLFGECVTPFAFVGAVDCLVANNTIRGQAHNWLFRVLQETTSRDGFTFLETQGCRLANNLFYFSRANLSTYVNVGPNTQGDTYTIERNLWYAADDPDRSLPTNLPATESGGLYGQDPFPEAASAPQITASSPAAGAGTVVPGVAGDHAGRCFGAPPSIGAFEVP